MKISSIPRPPATLYCRRSCLRTCTSSPVRPRRRSSSSSMAICPAIVAVTKLHRIRVKFWPLVRSNVQFLRIRSISSSCHHLQCSCPQENSFRLVERRNLGLGFCQVRIGVTECKQVGLTDLGFRALRTFSVRPSSPFSVKPKRVTKSLLKRKSVSVVPKIISRWNQNPLDRILRL